MTDIPCACFDSASDGDDSVITELAWVRSGEGQGRVACYRVHVPRLHRGIIEFGHFRSGVHAVKGNNNNYYNVVVV